MVHHGDLSPPSVIYKKCIGESYCMVTLNCRLRHRFFFKLKEAINEKLSSHTRHDKSKNERRKVTFNVLVTGGSVPSGHGCLTLEPMEWFEKNNIPVSEEEHEGMHRWCSWPRRFIETFQYAINR